MHYHALSFVHHSCNSILFLLTCNFALQKGIPFLPSWASRLLQEDIVVSGPFQLPRSWCCRLFLDTWSLQSHESNHDHTISTHFLLDTAFGNDKLSPNKVSLGHGLKAAFSSSSNLQRLQPKTKSKLQEQLADGGQRHRCLPLTMHEPPRSCGVYNYSIYNWSWWKPRKSKTSLSKNLPAQTWNRLPCPSKVEFSMTSPDLT